MYIYRTSGFNEKAERYGIRDRIDDLCTQLQTQRLDEVQSRFERVYPYLKRRILNRRLIGRILHLDDQQLLCFIDIFKRGDHDYEQFLEAPETEGFPLSKGDGRGILRGTFTAPLAKLCISHIFLNKI